VDTLDTLVNMSTGPVEVSQRVLRAQLHPFVSPHHADFWSVYDDLSEKLKRIVKTRNDPIITHGSIRTAMDVAIMNAVEPGDKVLVLSNGYWGDLFGSIVTMYGGTPVILRETGRPLNVDKIEDLLKREQGFKAATCVHVETNNGILNPIDKISRLVKSHGLQFIVDTAMTAGCVDVRTDEWGIDFGITGSQKGLCALPGLGIVTVSEEGWKSMEARKTPLRAWYFNFRDWRERMLTKPHGWKTGQPAFTLPSTLIYALHEAVTEILDSGMEIFFQQHDVAGKAFRAGLRAAGLELANQYEDASVSTVTAILVPKGVMEADLRKTLEAKHHIFIVGNIGELAGKSVRVGLMSPPQVREPQVIGTLFAILCTMRDLGAKVDVETGMGKTAEIYGYH
jgi:alanine-glyoxylate transaminase/serine-glyoxylate transaminase/serine-pyruvate transaminase